MARRYAEFLAEFVSNENKYSVGWP